MVDNDKDHPFEYHFLNDQLALFDIEDDRRQAILIWPASMALPFHSAGGPPINDCRNMPIELMSNGGFLQSQEWLLY